MPVETNAQANATASFFKFLLRFGRLDEDNYSSLAPAACSCQAHLERIRALVAFPFRGSTMWRQIVSMPAGLAVCFSSFAADFPVKEVILYKHGVGYYTRAGELKPGETARLEFKADDMNDVLKSLTVTDRDGGKVSSVRYDASESLDKRLENFPFSTGDQTTLAAFLDQMKGARLELKLGSETVAGAILGARVVKGGEKDAERQTVTLFGDAGDMRTFDLAAASSI